MKKCEIRATHFSTPEPVAWLPWWLFDIIFLINHPHCMARKWLWSWPPVHGTSATRPCYFDYVLQPDKGHSLDNKTNKMSAEAGQQWRNEKLFSLSKKEETFSKIIQLVINKNHRAQTESRSLESLSTTIGTTCEWVDLSFIIPFRWPAHSFQFIQLSMT